MILYADRNNGFPWLLGTHADLLDQDSRYARSRYEQNWQQPDPHYLLRSVSIQPYGL